MHYAYRTKLWLIQAALTAFFMVSAPAAAGQPTPYKLVIVWHQSNLTVIDYPNLPRCEAARKAVTEEIRRRNEQADADAPPGAIRIGRSPNGAFCIPG